MDPRDLVGVVSVVIDSLTTNVQKLKCLITAICRKAHTEKDGNANEDIRKKEIYVTRY